MVPVTTTRREGRGGGGWKERYIGFEMRPRTRNPAGKRRRRLLISANIFATRRRTSTFRNRNRHQILPKIKRTNIPLKPKLVSPFYLCTKAANADIKKATSTQSWYSCKKAWATSSNLGRKLLQCCDFYSRKPVSGGRRGGDAARRRLAVLRRRWGGRRRDGRGVGGLYMKPTIKE